MKKETMKATPLRNLKRLSEPMNRMHDAEDVESKPVKKHVNAGIAAKGESRVVYEAAGLEKVGTPNKCGGLSSKMKRHYRKQRGNTGSHSVNESRLVPAATEVDVINIDKVRIADEWQALGNEAI